MSAVQTCRACGQTKRVEAFRLSYGRSGNVTGRRPTCRLCETSRTREQRQLERARRVDNDSGDIETIEQRTQRLTERMPLRGTPKIREGERWIVLH